MTPNKRVVKICFLDNFSIFLFSCTFCSPKFRDVLSCAFALDAVVALVMLGSVMVMLSHFDPIIFR